VTLFKTSLNFEPPVFENATRYPKSETKVQCCDDRPVSLESLVKLGQCTPEKALSVLSHPYTPQKNCMRKGAKLSITGPRIIQFRSNFVLSLNTGHPKCCKSSRSRGQRSRSQRNITCAKISQNYQ